MSRILEITRFGLLKSAKPDHTEWVRLGGALSYDPDEIIPVPLTFGTYLRIISKVLLRKYDLIVLNSLNSSYQWDTKNWKKTIRKIINSKIGGTVVKGVLTIIIGKKTKTILIDYYDSTDISFESIRAVPNITAYLKRELITNEKYERIISPISFFVPDENRIIRYLSKKVDVFFCCTINSIQRQKSLDILLELKNEGYLIDIADPNLNYSEYMSRMGSAYICVSPQGYGWDGYRHYEACAAGTVPIINSPSYTRTKYLIDGVHCYYSDNQFNDLKYIIENALSDRYNLINMGSNAQKFVMENFTRSAVGRKILAITEEQENDE